MIGLVPCSWLHTVLRILIINDLLSPDSFIQQPKKAAAPSVREKKKIKWKTIIIFAVLNATFHTSITFGSICMCVFVARCLPLRLNIEYSRISRATRLIHLVSLIQISRKNLISYISFMDLVVVMPCSKMLCAFVAIERNFFSIFFFFSSIRFIHERTNVIIIDGVE